MLKCQEEVFGFTGGTIDKLESIPGYRVQIEMDEFISNVEKAGISIIAQTMNLAPSDKKIYALRDSIACVGNIPLIASSIMSKKIASGADKIVLDVTVGKGAFMKDMENATKLANKMIEIGKIAGRETICVLTNMDEPLGNNIGNNLEVIEVIEFLNGKEILDLKEVVFELGSYMIKLAGLGESIEENKVKMQEVIDNGRAFEKFKELVKIQGGDTRYLDDINLFPKASNIIAVHSNKQGYIEDINAEDVGRLSGDLGAGRKTKEDVIDFSAGIVLVKKVGDYCKENDVLGYIYTNNSDIISEAKEKLLDIFKISDKQQDIKSNIRKIII